MVFHEAAETRERTEKELPGALMAPNTSVHPLLEAQLHSSTYIPFFTLATFSQSFLLATKVLTNALNTLIP